jgi:transposase
MAGRKPKQLDDKQKAQVEALAAVLSQEQIADYFGIGRTTWYSMLERDADIAEHYKRGKAKAIGAVAQGLLQKARAGDTTSAIFYLKTQARWRETTHLDHTSSDGSLMPSRIEIIAPDADKPD